MPFARRVVLRGAAQGIAVGTAALLGLWPRTTEVTSSSLEFDLPTAIPAPPTYHVSNGGDDSNDGLSPGAAWATIQKANDALPGDGSCLLFRRGDTFYGELNLPFGCEVGAYGEGPRPILTMFKLLTRPDGWAEESPGIWKIDLGSPDTHLGYTATTDANIGFLDVDGVVRPALKFDLSELSTTWDFYCDIPNNTLFVKSPGNPALLSDSIKAAPKGNAYGATGTIIYCRSGKNEIHDVHITGTGACGIRGNGSDVHVHDCLIDYIGGSWLAGQYAANTRYGNGIEHWPNVRRWTIENNEIAEVYDVAWSPQGRDPEGGPVCWEDMVVRNNHIHDCAQMFELWSQNGNPDSPGFVRIVVEGNLCERAGGGVFSDVRPDQNVRVDLLSYKLQTPVDITIQNNTFDGAHTAYSYHENEPPAGYVTRNNTIRLKAGTKIQFQRDETVEEAAAWQAATGREVGSNFIVVP